MLLQIVRCLASIPLVVHRLSLSAPNRFSAILKRIVEQMTQLAQRYARSGHPSLEELTAAQGLTFPREPSELLGDFWPQEESTEEFLQALRESRLRP